MNNRIAFAGTRGLPANYGGFETAVDEISRRFVAAGYACDVFCRRSHANEPLTEHRGRRLIYMRGAASARLETFASALQTGWYLRKHRAEYAHVFWFNNANLPGILLSLMAGIPTTVNTDGLEWKRRKWPAPFKAYYFVASWLISRVAPRLISDSFGIQDYYQTVFHRDTDLIPYGVPDAPQPEAEAQAQILAQFNLKAGKYFIQITRFEPDNLPLEIAQQFAASRLTEQGYQFVAVGLRDETPYARKLKALAGENTGVRVIPATYETATLFALRANCFAYVHGNSVGGTNPALLEAMAACPRILAVDVPFSREVLAGAGLYFNLENLHVIFQRALAQPEQRRVFSQQVAWYDWGAVARAYQNIADGLQPQYPRRAYGHPQQDKVK